MFDKFHARVATSSDTNTPRVYRMEFHLLNEREIKTIRLRTSQFEAACEFARARARPRATGTL